MISREILKKIKRIEITTRHLVDTVLQGEYLSSFKGRGIEFTEVREYQEGDDIRAIDWNVTARMNSPYIKVFIEERELQVIFAADLSGSLDFGSKENLKSELMFEFVAALGFTANINNDRVGFLGFSTGLEKYVPPKKGRKHVLRILRELAYHEQKKKETNLSESLLYLSHILRRRSTVFVISDFYDEKDYYNSLKVLKYHHDVIAVVLRDRRDYEMPDIGYAPFVDPETNAVTWADTADKNYSVKLKRSAEAADKKLFKSFNGLGVDYMVLNCGESYIKTLITFFKKRERQAGQMRFENINLLLPGIAAALLLMAALLWRNIKFTGINFSNFSSLLKASSKQQFLYYIPDILKIAGIILLVVALLRPQVVKKETQEKIKGIDIMLALDISGSMQAEDLKPNRLEAAKGVCREFVSGLVNDRAGLVVFAGKAFTQCPLTIDYEIVKSFIDQVDLQTIRIDGTAIGEALLTATNRLEASGTTKVIILATDGGNNRGMSPVEAAKIAAFKGIKIYTIGIGKKGGSPMVYMDNYGIKRQAVDRYTGQPLKWEEPDEASLKQVAEIGKGRYFRATDERSLKEIYGIIGKLEKQDIQVKTYDRREDKFVWFLWAGFIMLLLALGLEAWKFLRVVA